MVSERFVRISVCGDWGVKDTVTGEVLFFGTTDEVINTYKLLNTLAEDNKVLGKQLSEANKENDMLKQFLNELKESGYWTDDYLTEQDWNDIKIWVDIVLGKLRKRSRVK